MDRLPSVVIDHLADFMGWAVTTRTSHLLDDHGILESVVGSASSFTYSRLHRDMYEYLGIKNNWHPGKGEEES